ncbi:hypothetical protein FIBSPDRAFT_932566 [Athelia psychrophila]|uniref:Family A G protein-coupled receptor-like protein n=1 Tax=Athelia psychrophila TaxID=1759441 RepID=A0A166IM33_9AGAM|nr:hypothetical protein FIBSPDRAFT_932566 [Fibularhizoctonia sp. CBS 109695]
MLPFALKAVWFGLSVSGTLACWAVLITLARTINIYWFPFLYCSMITALEGIFCLGMVYHMDPFQMPDAFRLAQIFIISFSALALTGLALSFIWATTASVVWPGSVSGSAKSTLSWRHVYFIPILIIPTVFAVAQIALVVAFDAYAPSDNLHADVTGPLWICLLGYAGMPMIESIPCFCLTVYAGMRVARIHRVQSTQHNSTNIGTRTDPFSVSVPAMVRMPQPGLDEDPDVDGWTKMDELSPGRSPSSLSIGGRHAAAKPPSVISVGNEKRQHGKSPSQAAQARFHIPYNPRATASPTSKAMESSWRDSTFAYPTMEEEDALDADVEDKVQAKMGRKPQAPIRLDKISHRSQLTAPQKKIIPLVWRLILFHAIFFLIQILVTLSTLVDVGRHRPTLTPFGTEHIALLLAAWGPVAIFSHSPGVRQRLMFWR